MKKNIIFFSFVLTIFCLSTLAFNPRRMMPQNFRIAFWNVENLFDTFNDPATNDDDYTPEGKLSWSKERYDTKLQHTAKVLTEMAENRPMPIVGLSEIENIQVLQDLLQLPEMQKLNYTILHQNSKDERGIDVALLYQKMWFNPICTHWLEVPLQGKVKDYTRDILYCQGKIMMDTIHVFVNHWPSRREGQEVSEWKRIKAAEVVKNKISEIENENPKAKIIILGDLNDEPDDASVNKTLSAQGNIKAALKSYSFFNLMYAPFKQGKGTMVHDGDYQVFDQVIVSSELISPNTTRLYIPNTEGTIFAPDWMSYTDSKTKMKRPDRTFSGTKYYGGYSDHYPVYVDMKIK